MEWINTIVGEYCPFIYGKSLPQNKRENGNIPVYGSNGIVGFHSKSCVVPHGIIIGRKGSVGAVHLSEKEFWAIDTAFYIVKDDLDELRFTYYLLKTLGLSTMNSDSAVPGLNRENAHSLNIRIPKNFNDRKIIGKKLALFDQKIHLNQQTNQTLEHIAQAIFKSWFVDFDPVRAKADCLANGGSMADANLSAMSVISGKSLDELAQLQANNPQDYDELWQLAEHFPCEWVENAEFGEVPKGWGSATLSAICKMQNGYAFKSSDWQDEGVPVIKIGSIQSNIIDVFGNGFVDLKFTETKKDFILRSGDIVIALTGAYVGKAGVMPANSLAMLNQRVAKFLPNIILNKTSYYAYIYCLSQQKTLKDYIGFSAQGSAQPNISTRELLNYPIILANDEIHLSFEKVIQKNLDMIISNSGENEQLTKTRDELLPKLLSGEIEL